MHILELLLNGFWLAIAGWSVVYLHPRWRRIRRARGADSAPSLLVFSCLLALLFPIISITDDLNDANQLAEESAGRRSRLTCSTSPQNDSSPVASTPCRGTFVAPDRAIASISAPLAFSPQLVERIPSFTRGPPPFLY